MTIHPVAAIPLTPRLVPLGGQGEVTVGHPAGGVSFNMAVDSKTRVRGPDLPPAWTAIGTRRRRASATTSGVRVLICLCPQPTRFRVIRTNRKVASFLRP